MGMGSRINPHSLRENREKFIKELNSEQQWYKEEEIEEYLRKTRNPPRNPQNAKKYYKRRDGFEK